jgi:hypothetical protein
MNLFVNNQWNLEPLTTLFDEEIIFLLELIKNTLVDFDTNLTEIRAVFRRQELPSFLDPHFANDNYSYIGTLLHVAARNNLPLLIHWLTKNNVDLTANDSHNAHALFQAVFSPDLAAAMAILEQLESKNYPELNLAPLLARFLSINMEHVVEKDLCIDFIKKIFILSRAQFFVPDNHSQPLNIVNLFRIKNCAESLLIPALQKALTHFEIPNQIFHNIHFFQEQGIRPSQKQVHRNNTVYNMCNKLNFVLNEAEKKLLRKQLPHHHQVMFDDSNQGSKKMGLCIINDLLKKLNLPQWDLKTLDEFLNHPFYENNHVLPIFSCYEYIQNLKLALPRDNNFASTSNHAQVSTNNNNNADTPTSNNSIASINTNIRCFILEYCREHINAQSSLFPGNN